MKFYYQVIINFIIKIKNCYLLYLGDASSDLEPRRIDQLCKKNIIDIAYGSGPHVLANSAGKF